MYEEIEVTVTGGCALLWVYGCPVGNVQTYDYATHTHTSDKSPVKKCNDICNLLPNGCDKSFLIIS